MLTGYILTTSNRHHYKNWTTKTVTEFKWLFDANKRFDLMIAILFTLMDTTHLTVWPIKFRKMNFFKKANRLMEKSVGGWVRFFSVLSRGRIYGYDIRTRKAHNSTGFYTFYLSLRRPPVRMRTTYFPSINWWPLGVFVKEFLGFFFRMKTPVNYSPS